VDIYFATTNEGKVHILQKDLGAHGIRVIQRSIDLIEPRSSDVQEIAASKIKQAYALIQKPTVVIDAGFYIDSIHGFPRAFVNFVLETIGVEGILKLVEGKPRGCEFRECLAYMDSTLKEPKYFVMHIRGTLASGERGSMQKHLWSVLGLIFIPDGSDKTLAEMSYDELMAWRTSSQEQYSLGELLHAWLSEHNNNPESI
jgi:XTP/dITP diphosphohydrolase